MVTKITKDDLISEIFEQYPEQANNLAEAMIVSGMHCVGCSVSNIETIEQGAKSHGLKDKEIRTLLRELNSIVE
ncbi:MAG: DUF1858 domain-containing protein [Candidatus Pacearchaeota archaeon]